MTAGVALALMWQRATIAALVPLVLASAASAAPVTLPAPGMLKADGSISGLTRAGSRIVLTGSFSHIGPYVGGAVALDPGSGARDPGFARIDGQVSDAIADGEGGWYVGGQFDIGGERRAVAHVRASGAIDPDFDAPRGLEFVAALARAGDVVYAGVYFPQTTKVRAVWALDADTGRRIDGFRPFRGFSVTELLAEGGRLYVGRVDGGVRAIDPATGAAVAGFDCACDGHVTALARHGSALYVGTTTGIAAVDAATGAAIPAFAPAPNRFGTPGPDFGPLVFLVQGDRLIVGGAGMRLGGPSANLVALDLATGAADSAFGAGTVNPVHDLVLDGDTLYAAGAPREGRTAPVLKLDAGNGAYRDALTPELDGPIDALAMGARRLFVGGRFGASQPTTTDGVAVVSARTGRLVPGFSVSDPTRSVGYERPIVAGGALIFPRQTRTSGAVAYALRTGARRNSFHPSPIPASGSATWAGDGDRLFVAYPVGALDSLWHRNDVRVLSSRTGRRLAGYELPYRGYVEALLPHRGQLFVGGSFLRTWSDGRPRNLATMALDPMTGAIDDGFDAHTNGPVESLVGFRDRLYLGGYYDVAYGLERPGQSSAYDNTGAIAGGFNRRVYVTGHAGELLTAFDPDGDQVLVEPYLGSIASRLPTLRDGYIGSAISFAPRGGTFVTATLDLPYYAYGGSYDTFAGFVRATG